MSDHVDLGIVVPVYNKEHFIQGVVTSLLEQSVRPAQIVVVDDGSTDGSVRQLEPLRDRITLLRQENAGASVARNRGIEQLKTRWVAFADADNHWHPQRLEWIWDFIARNPSTRWLSGQYWLLLPSGQTECRPTPPDPSTEFLSYFDVVDAMPGLHSVDTLVAQRDLLQQLGGFHAPLRCFETTLMYLKLAFAEPRMGFLAKPSVDAFLVTSASTFRERSRSVDNLAEFARALVDLHREQTPAPPVVRRLILRTIEDALYFAKRNRNYQKLANLLAEFGEWLPNSKQWRYLVHSNLGRAWSYVAPSQS